jgi:hypothetical protein
MLPIKQIRKMSGIDQNLHNSEFRTLVGKKLNEQDSILLDNRNSEEVLGQRNGRSFFTSVGVCSTSYSQNCVRWSEFCSEFCFVRIVQPFVQVEASRQLFTGTYGVQIKIPLLKLNHGHRIETHILPRPCKRHMHILTRQNYVWSYRSLW